MARSTAGALFWAALLLSNPAPASIPTTVALLERQISKNPAGDFSALIQSWKKQPRNSALASLLEIARNERKPDKTRSIALIGAASLSARTPSAETVRRTAVRLLVDRAWLVRLYSIKALEECGSTGKAELLAARLNDPSLMVRAEAAEALYRLALHHPQEGNRPVLRELSRSVESSSNYVQGRALWVPQRSIAALGEFKAKSELEALSMLVRKGTDARLAPHLAQARKRAERSTVKNPSAREVRAPSARARGDRSPIESR
jgi:HEAT repeat protein